jgi:SAM-dependent methyltransferase
LPIDTDTKATAQAKQRGLDARTAAWPDFEEEPFDVILFTRSLHHIQPLSRAVSQAKQLLKVPGKVLVEDFAFNEIEPLAAEWLYQLLTILDAGCLLRRRGDRFADQLLRQGGALAAWKAAHDQHLHTAAAMTTCLQDYFPCLDSTNAPYLYRYVCELLVESEQGYALALQVLDLEKRFAEVAGCSLIGRRFVGTLVSA